MRWIALVALASCAQASPHRVMSMKPRLVIAPQKGLTVPADWEPKGFFPEAPAIGLRTTWTRSSECRWITYAGEERRSRHAGFVDLVARLKGDDASRAADSQTGKLRLFLEIRREQTIVRACVDGVEPPNPLALLASHPALAPLETLIARSSLRFHTATEEMDRSGRRLELTFLTTYSSQKAFARTLVETGFARPTSLASAVESTSPERSFVLYGPDELGESMIQIASR